MNSMWALLRLAILSLRNRKFTTVLTITSIALSVSLLLSVERTKRAAEDGFTQAVSKTDLLVGGRTGPLNLILFTVFNMGSISNNVSWESYQAIKANPKVEWTIPYSLGDGHRGFRVIGTDENFYEHYRFRGDQKVEFQSGQMATGVWDAVIGSAVEEKLKYKMGDKIIVAHGVTHGEGLQHHDNKPFHVVGILKPTGTAIDQSIYITLYGMEGMHIDWSKGAPPKLGEETPPDQILKDKIKIDEITAFFIRTKSRIETLGLQREINDYEKEPLLAIIPGATLAELWKGLSQIDQVLKVISILVLAVGLASMLSSILTSLNERRREMSILRSLGAGPKRITALLVFESLFLTISGVILGLVLELTSFSLISGWLESRFGFYVVGTAITKVEMTYLLVIIIFGFLIGFIPAIRATRLALKDGLSVKM